MSNEGLSCFFLCSVGAVQFKVLAGAFTLPVSSLFHYYAVDEVDEYARVLVEKV